jgi:hypothetical protein
MTILTRISEYSSVYRANNRRWHLVVLVMFIVFLASTVHISRPSLIFGTRIGSVHTTPIDWQDVRNYNQDQCKLLFPRLFHHADLTAEWYRKNGGISRDAVDAAEKDGNARVIIHDNKVGRRSIMTTLEVYANWNMVTICDLAIRQEVCWRMAFADSSSSSGTA